MNNACLKDFSDRHCFCHFKTDNDLLTNARHITSEMVADNIETVTEIKTAGIGALTADIRFHMNLPYSGLLRDFRHFFQ